MTYTVRRAQDRDLEQLFEWVNRKDSLKNKRITKSAVDWGSHCEWFRARLSDKNSYIFLIESDEGRPVGQARYQCVTGSNLFDVDIYLDEAARGQGVAKLLLSVTGAEILELNPSAVLRAVVHVDNLSSQKLFRSLGYKLEELGPEFLKFFYTG